MWEPIPPTSCFRFSQGICTRCVRRVRDGYTSARDGVRVIEIEFVRFERHMLPISELNGAAGRRVGGLQGSNLPVTFASCWGGGGRRLRRHSPCLRRIGWLTPPLVYSSSDGANVPGVTVKPIGQTGPRIGGLGRQKEFGCGDLNWVVRGNGSDIAGTHQPLGKTARMGEHR